MKFLILNEKKELGAKIDFNQYKLNIFNALEPESLIYEMLIEDEVETKSVSLTGNVDVDLIKQVDVQLEIYNYVYIIEKESDAWFVKYALDNELYVDLVLRLMDSTNFNIGYSRLYLLSEVLLCKPLKRRKLNNILNKIRVFIEKSNRIDSGYIYLIKVLENIIPEDFKSKKHYMKGLYSLLDKNNILIYFLTGDEKKFLEQNSRKYNLDVYSKIKNIIESNVDVEGLPF